MTRYRIARFIFFDTAAGHNRIFGAEAGNNFRLSIRNNTDYYRCFFQLVARFFIHVLTVHIAAQRRDRYQYDMIFRLRAVMDGYNALISSLLIATYTV